MELIDTPNPNAKKIETTIEQDEVKKALDGINGVASIFIGPGFVTIIKDENIEWESITQDIVSIFDKL
tara:strand:- start:1543 stop:1746 length:204 start_codon:yes stop_codon:yes gene_type:complete